MKVLIIGDSFAADWSLKYNDYLGWPNILSLHHTVTNLAQAGVSEYRIMQQLSSANLGDYDIVIVAHTSPWRVPTRQNPVHESDLLHGHCDLLLSDIEYHATKLINIFNRPLRVAYGFFKYHFDPDFFETSYCLIRQEINRRLKDKYVITLENFDSLKFKDEKHVLSLLELNKVHSGVINHLSEQGNQIVFELINKELTNV